GLDDTPIACVHPGATRPENRWPPERFAAVADELASRGHRVVLTGTDGERPLVARVADAMRAPAVDLAGRTDIGTFAALVADARVVVSNDTGAAHVAAATRTPSVVVFAPDGDPERWAPLDVDRHRRVGGGPAPDGWATVADVVRALDELARRPGRRAARGAGRRRSPGPRASSGSVEPTAGPP